MISKITNNISPLDEVNKINEIVDNINKYRIGDVIQSTIPLGDERLHISDGSRLFQSDIYESFVGYMRYLYESNYLYAWVYNDGSENHIIYTNTDSLIPSITVLYNADGTEYTGTDFDMVFETNCGIEYQGNLCDYMWRYDIQLQSCFTDEITWQNAVNTYGSCGKFVYIEAHQKCNGWSYGNEVIYTFETSPGAGSNAYEYDGTNFHKSNIKVSSKSGSTIVWNGNTYTRNSSKDSPRVNDASVRLPKILGIQYAINYIAISE